MEDAEKREELGDSAVRQLEKRGMPIPGLEGGRPALGAGLEFFYEAFAELSTERRESAMPIPWSSIRAYAKAADADADLEQEIHGFTRALDREYLRIKKEQHDRRSDK